MYSLSGRPPDVRSTPNIGPIADILRSRRWANSDREFTLPTTLPMPTTIPTNLGRHREVAPYSWITSMAERWDPGSISCAEQVSQSFGGVPFALPPGEFRDSRLHRQVE